MDYQNTLLYLYNSVPMFQQVGSSAYKEGLENTLALDEHFGHPHRNFHSIHVGGTNGKGSCSHTLAAILQEAGYRVGLYTSPHLVDFRERIRINEQPIPEEYVVRFVEKERDFFESLHPSFFELTTAMAFRYFADEHVDVLFGNVNPSGKLTATFPKSVGQIPLFYNHKNTGRPLPQGAWFQKFRSNYLDVDNEPLYPFGYGLSYTTFSYSDITLDKSSMNINGEITATVTVTNTGKYDGSEVVQLYIRDLIGSVTRPVKELKGFEKIFLKAGESKQVSFKLTADMLKFYNYNLDFVCEPGDFEVMIGGDSRDVNKALFSLQ